MPAGVGAGAGATTVAVMATAIGVAIRPGIGTGPMAPGPAGLLTGAWAGEWGSAWALGAGGGAALAGVAVVWWPSAPSRITWRGLPRAACMARSSRGRRPCTMAIQLPATRTTARWPSSRTKVACWESNIRVEGSSRPVRICCQSSGRLAPAPGPPWPAGAGSGFVVGTGSGAGVGAGTVWAGPLAWATGAFAGPRAWGLAGALPIGAAGTAAVPWPGGAATPVGWANRPNTNTSSQRRGWTLWRSCCSLPFSWLCHCSNLAVPNCWASSGSWGRNWGEKLVSSSRSGATAASTRSRSRLVRPCNTADGSRPRSSSSRQASTTPRGSKRARAVARARSSCSGTAPTSSHTAIGSIGAGSRLSWSSRLSASRRPPWARWATTCRASAVMPICSSVAI